MGSNPLVNIISRAEFDSELQVPSGWTDPSYLNFEHGGAPPNNARLAIKLRYKLEFADSKNRVPGVIVRRDGIDKAKDDTGFAHTILDWDAKSRSTFRSAFERGEKIWTRRFLLLTPLNYREFDFTLPHHPSATLRPNVVCLFVMSASDTPHIKITVVRADRATNPMPFRASMTLYDDQVPWNPTLGHELGHAIGMKHIKVMLGDAACAIEPNEDRCYGETEEEKANIMGSGTKLLPLNAAPWLDRIAAHTMTPRPDWSATLYLRTKPQIFT